VLELEQRIVMALQGELKRHTEAALQKPANPSLYDYGYVSGVSLGLQKALQLVLSAISQDEEEDGHGRVRRGKLPGS
jgi:hypothetical protein